MNNTYWSHCCPSDIYLFYLFIIESYTQTVFVLFLCFMYVLFIKEKTDVTQAEK